MPQLVSMDDGGDELAISSVLDQESFLEGGGRYRDCVKMTDDIVVRRQKRNSGNVLCIERKRRADERVRKDKQIK